MTLTLTTHLRPGRAIRFPMVCVLCLLPAVPTFAQQDAPETPRHALLIGVGKYPGLGNSEQLDGSANDVAAMRELLTKRFAFAEDNVTSLIDEQATGEGIRQAIGKLIATVNDLPPGSPTAQVVVHFSGHGSQVPDQPSGPDRDEDDGLDETWVPSDASQQGGDEDIRDDEINELATSLCANGKAQLLIVVDGCHSGTGARGSTKVRQLRREVTPTESSEAMPITRKRLPEGAVFLSACRAKEVEPELQEGDKTYGLLTRFLVETLSEERKVSTLSYDLLQKAIVSRYQRDRRIMRPPTPQLEGDINVLLKSSVLGFGPDMDREAYYPVNMVSPVRAVVQAGRFHNVTVGSLFELYEQPDDIDSAPSAGWLEINKVDGTTSEARVVRVDDTELIDAEVPRTIRKGIAILRQQAAGDTGLSVKVVRVEDGNGDSQPLTAADSQVPTAVATALNASAAEGESQWLSWITEPQQPSDLILRIHKNAAAIFPATGASDFDLLASKTRGRVANPLRGGWGPIDLASTDTDLPPSQVLTDYLRRIARARNLISLAQSAPDNSSAYDIQLDLQKLDYDRETQQVRSQNLWQPDEEPDGVLANTLTVHEGDVYAVRVTNRQTDGKPVYVTVLEISPDMGIEVVMPYDEPPIKLEPGDHRDGEPFESAGPHGQWHAIVLATREPSDFGFIKQTHLPKTRGGPKVGGVGSLTDQLAEFTHFQPPRTRGRLVRKKAADNSWYAKVLSWRTAP